MELNDKNPHPEKLNKSSAKLTTAMIASAASLTLLNTAQNPAQAQGRFFKRPLILKQQTWVQYSEQDAAQKYFNNGLNYIDAMVLASFWGERSPSAAKVRMGNKMLAFGPRAGLTHLHAARKNALRKPLHQMPVDYTDGGYTWHDVQLLGLYWGGGPSNSKTKIATFLIEGKDAWTKAALKAAKAGG